MRGLPAIIALTLKCVGAASVAAAQPVCVSCSPSAAVMDKRDSVVLAMGGGDGGIHCGGGMHCGPGCAGGGGGMGGGAGGGMGASSGGMGGAGGMGDSEDGTRSCAFPGRTARRIAKSPTVAARGQTPERPNCRIAPTGAKSGMNCARHAAGVARRGRRTARSGGAAVEGNFHQLPAGRFRRSGESPVDRAGEICRRGLGVPGCRQHRART